MSYAVPDSQGVLFRTNRGHIMMQAMHGAPVSNQANKYANGAQYIQTDSTNINAIIYTYESSAADGASSTWDGQSLP